MSIRCFDRIGGFSVLLLAGAAWCPAKEVPNSAPPLARNFEAPVVASSPQESGENRDLPDFKSRGVINNPGDVDEICVTDPSAGETIYIFVLQTGTLFGGPILDPIVSVTNQFGSQQYFGNGAPVRNDDMASGTTGALDLSGFSFLSLPGFSYLTARPNDSGLGFGWPFSSPFCLRISGYGSSTGNYVVVIF